MEIYWVAPGFFHQEHHTAQRLFRQGLISNTLLFSSSMSKSPILWFWSGKLSFEGPKVCVELCGNMVLFYILFLRTLNMICRNEIWRHGQPTVEITPRRGSCWYVKRWKKWKLRDGHLQLTCFHLRNSLTASAGVLNNNGLSRNNVRASSPYIVLPAPEVFLGCADFWTNALLSSASRKCLFTCGD